MLGDLVWGVMAREARAFWRQGSAGVGIPSHLPSGALARGRGGVGPLPLKTSQVLLVADTVA